MGSPTAQLIAQELNQSPADLVAAVDAALVAASSMGLQTCLVTRRSYAPGPRFTVTLVYTVPAQLVLRAASFIGTPTSSAESLANAFLAAHPTYRGHFLRDIGDQRRGHLGIDALMLIYATSSKPNCGYDRSRMIVVQALGNILPGASGAALIMSATGSTNLVTVTNQSVNTFAFHTFGYAFPRAGDCTYDVVPTCCP